MHQEWGTPRRYPGDVVAVVVLAPYGRKVVKLVRKATSGVLTTKGIGSRGASIKCGRNTLFSRPAG
jgi:hypothetical protein